MYSPHHCRVRPRHRYSNKQQGASRMVLESALAIALEGDKLEKDDKIQKGGVLTPASGLGDTLLQRLKAAGFYFNIVDA